MPKKNPIIDTVTEIAEVYVTKINPNKPVRCYGSLRQKGVKEFKGVKVVKGVGVVRDFSGSITS